MKKLQTLIAAFLLSIFSATSAMSEYAVGVTGAYALLDASGTETEGGEQTSTDIDHNFGLASIFAEYTMGSITMGLDYIPFAADVSEDVKSRTDVETSVTGTVTETTTSRSQKAQAEIDQHLTFYATYELTPGFYVKAGYVMADLTTTESLGTGSKYGDETLDGYTIGVGFQGDVGANSFMRGEYTYTDYDDISLTSSVARTGVTTNNKVTGDIDVSQFKVSYGYKF